MRDNQLPQQPTPDPTQTNLDDNRIVSDDTDNSPETFSLPMPGPEILPSTENVPLHLTDWKSFTTNFNQSFSQGDGDTLWRALRNRWDQADTSGDNPVLSPDEVEQIKKDHRGITFPDNVRKRTSDALVSDFNARQTRKFLLDNFQPTTGGEITGFAGELAGNIIGSPISTIAAVGTGVLARDPEAIPELFGVERTAINNIIRRVIGGAAAGAAFGATQESARFDEDATNGETFDPLRASINIGETAFLGGSIDAISGSLGEAAKKLLKNRPAASLVEADEANQTAAEMMKQGRDPNVKYVLDKAYKTQVIKLHKDMVDQGLSNEEVLDSLDNVDKKLKPKIKSNNLKVKKFEDEFVKNKFTSAVRVKNLLNRIDVLSTQDDDISKKELSNLTTKRQLIFNSLKKKFPKKSIKAITKQYLSLKNTQSELDNQFKSLSIYKDMVTKSTDPISKREFDDFVNINNESSSDFANGRGQENLDVVGRPLTDEEALLNDAFTDDEKTKLIEGTELSDEQKDFLDRLDGLDDENTGFQKAINDTINCLTGGINV